ncbi:MAG: LPS export ABC transporter permease LptG [Gammaproteobacteria bacterium]|nr:LPS export ABC transporter permease LptG [Gammaproteobacteria bacterium]
MNTLDRYITTHANRSIGVVALSLISLISLFALLNELDEYQATYGLREAALYVLRTLPRRLDEIMVYSVFLGYLIALGRLAETNEITIFRVSGMSPWRIVRALVPSMMLWLVISLVLSEYVAPGSERSAEVNKLQAQHGKEASLSRGGLWIRSGNLFMRVRAFDEKGQLHDVTQYWLNQDTEMVQSTFAETAQYNELEQHWVLHSGSTTLLTKEKVSKHPFEELIWDNPITPNLLASQAFLEPNKMSMLALLRQIEFARTQQSGVSEYELAFWSRALKPVTYFGLTLFALAVVMGPLRKVGMGVRLTFGIFAGLGFKYLQDLFAPAAMVFNIPALIAILLPISLYWCIAWVLIRRNA